MVWETCTLWRNFMSHLTYGKFSPQASGWVDFQAAELIWGFLYLIQCVTLSRVHPVLTSQRLDMLSQSFFHSLSCLTNHCIVPAFNWSCQLWGWVWKPAVGSSCSWAGTWLWISSWICLQWPVTGLGAWVSMCVSCSEAVINALPVWKDWLNVCVLQRPSMCREGWLLL